MQPTNPKVSVQSVWDARYRSENDNAFSWTELSESLSLQWITEACPLHSKIVDVGAGRSPLLDRLLERGYNHLTHVEWSEAASLDVRARLGKNAAGVNWYVGDVCDWSPEAPVDFWHDRAVFHFQTTDSAKQQYLQTLNRNLALSGAVLLATFHIEGPEKCSGFPVARYDAESLLHTLNHYSDVTWTLIRQCVHAHQTPSGAIQLFQYVLATKAA